MNILHVYKTYFPDTFGGCEKAIESLSEATHALGCKNHLLTITKDRERKSQKIKELTVNYFPSTLNVSSCPISVSLFRHFKPLVKEMDIIHYHFPWPFADLLHTMHKINKPYLVTYHSDIIRQKYLKYFYHPLMVRFLKNANVIVPTSQNLIHSSSVLNPLKEKCFPIPLCINPKDYQDKDNEYADFIQENYGNQFMLFIGVLRYYKGLHYLLKALEGLNIRLLIAGDGPEKNHLIHLSNRLGLKNVVFLGKVSDIQKNTLLTLCRGVVLPSHLPSEAFGVSLLEGLLFEKPLISTELGTGTSYVNQHLKTGLVVAPGDIKALKKALITLSTDQDAVVKWSSEAKHHFKENFTLDKIGMQYVERYKGML